MVSPNVQLATRQDDAIAIESFSRPAAVRSVRWHDEACPQAAPSRAASGVAILSMSAMRSCCHSCSGRRALADSSRDRSNSVSPLRWDRDGRGAQNLSGGKGVGREGGRPERERPELLFAVYATTDVSQHRRRAVAPPTRQRSWPAREALGQLPSAFHRAASAKRSRHRETRARHDSCEARPC